MKVQGPLSHLVFDSPTLSSLLSQCISTGRDFDGILFGHVRTITETSLRDDDGPSETHRKDIYVTGFSCNSMLGTFYDTHQSLSLQALQEMLGGRRQLGDICGYIVSRAFSSSRQPSQADRRIIENLFSLLPHCQHLVFGCFSPSMEHDNSCIVTGYTFFDFERGKNPRALSVKTRNLGTTLGREHYEDVEFTSSKGMERQVRHSHMLVEAMEQELLASFASMQQLASNCRDAELQAADMERQWMVKTGQMQGAAPPTSQAQKPQQQQQQSIQQAPKPELTDTLLEL